MQQEVWLNNQPCWSTPLFENDTFRLLMGWTVGELERPKAIVTRPDPWDRCAGLLIARVEERRGVYGLGWLPLIIPVRYGTNGVNASSSMLWENTSPRAAVTSITLGSSTFKCEAKLAVEVGKAIGGFVLNIEVGDPMEGNAPVQ